MTRRRLTTRNQDGGVSLGREVSPQEVIGFCFCGKPVWAAPGQSITWLTRSGKTREGELVHSEKIPTHKACRKTRAKI